MKACQIGQKIGFAACVLGIVLVTRAYANAPTYFFTNFETESGWSAGQLPDNNSAILLIQGEAKIQPFPEAQSKQVLELGPSRPYPAVFIDATPFANSAAIFCEVLAKPFATDGSGGEEFFDFGGAILGCFRVGTQAEIRALYGKSSGEAVWISTGIQFDLDAEGLPIKWIRLVIKLDRNSRTWSVSINGTPVISALRTVDLPSHSALPLWLFGNMTHGSLFDDLLICTVEPSELENTLGREEHRDIFTPSNPAKQIVIQTKPSIELRRPKVPDSPLKPPVSGPILRGWHVGLETGDRKYEKQIPGTNPPDNSILVYAPAYDEEGKRLPAVLTITADAELLPGTDLSLLRWEVAELKGWPDKMGETIGRGDFHTGLVQTFKLAPEWTQKATSIMVWKEKRRTGSP